MRQGLHRPLILGLGEILWDLLPAGKQLGGAPANFAYHAQALGARAAVVSAVGNDPLGREILSRLDDLSLDRFIALDPDHPTGTVTVGLDPAGHPHYTIHTKVAWDFIPSSPALTDLAASADALCFGTLAQRSPVSAATLRNLLTRARPEALRIFDVNLRQAFYSPALIADLLTLSSVLKLNDEELPVLAHLLRLPPAPRDALKALLDRYPLRLVALTRGPRGSLLATPRHCSDLPGTPVQIADTVGAGDAFTAALAVGLLQNLPLPRIHAWAAALAAHVCGQAGATPAVPPELRLPPEETPLAAAEPPQ